MSVKDYEEIPPEASTLLGSLRSFGYSLTEAIADLIDNSITAKADTVCIDFNWKGGESTISITDNGSGMSYEVLKSSMSLGVKGPGKERSAQDLGRFGLGMKTASLSQAQRMKVYTTVDGKTIDGLCWDLEYVATKNRWAARKLSAMDFKEESISSFKKGTSVILESLDRLLDLKLKDDNIEERKHFYNLAKQVQQSLGVIFHRYISGKKLKILINGSNEVTAFDPLHIDKEDTIILCNRETIRSDELKSKVTSVLLSKKNLEEEGLELFELTSRQGVYVYRNDRLVSWGRWLGLASGNNHDHKYFRVSIDFSSADDNSWNIDVKKTNVNIPRPFNKKLKILIKSGLGKSREMVWNNTFLRKGRETSVQPLWITASRKGMNVMLINRDYPLVKKMFPKKEGSKDLELLLKLIETSLNLNDSNYDSESDVTSQGFVEDSLQDLGFDQAEILSLYQSLRIKE